MKKQRIDIRQSRHAKPGLHDLCGYVKQHGSTNYMIEIGSFAGNSTEVFLKYFNYITCVDPWKSGFDENDILSDDSQFNMEEVYQQFKEIVVDPHKDRIAVLKLKSKEASQSIEDNSVDFVYIDGNHQADSVREDIELWYPKVKSGGLIGGHDYTSRKYPHIREVVDSFFSNITTFKDTSWITTKP